MRAQAVPALQSGGDEMTRQANLPSDQIDSALLMEGLQEAFATLAPIEADILRKRVGMDDEPEMTLKEIGERYSLSRERIRQLQEQALSKLRTEFEKRALL